MTFKDALKREIKYLPMWYVLVSGIQMLYDMITNYDLPGVHPHEFIEFGPGVFLTIFFPVLWVVIFAFCREIASKNKLLKDLEEKQKREGATP